MALHRYLTLRVPGYSYESHFGGVRYLFVRGMHPGAGAACGVYADRPQAALIEALDGYLRRGTAQAIRAPSCDSSFPETKV